MQYAATRVLDVSGLGRHRIVGAGYGDRVFRGEADNGDSVVDAVVMAVAEAAHDLVWAGAAAAQATAMEVYAANMNAGNDSATTTKDVLRANSEASWLLQAAGVDGERGLAGR